MSLEASLWDWLKKARSPALDMNRIENWIEPGTPDVEGHLKLDDCEGQFWLELKAEKRPARPETPIKFKVRKKQIEWMDRRWAIGGNAFWLVQVGAGADRRLYLAPGPLGRQLQRGLHEASLAIECVHTGVFFKRFSQIDILKRAISCRQNKLLFPR